MTMLLLALALVQDPAPAPAPEPAPRSISFGAAYSFWYGSFDFESRSATQQLSVEASHLQGVDLFGTYEVSPGWRARVDIETAWGLDMSLVGAAGGVEYHPDLGGTDGYARLSIAFATLDVDDVPGDFGAGLGVDLAAGVRLAPLPDLPALELQAELGLRFLEFPFDEDAGLLSSDSSTGGAGLRLLLGAQYRF